MKGNILALSLGIVMLTACGTQTNNVPEENSVDTSGMSENEAATAATSKEVTTVVEITTTAAEATTTMVETTETEAPAPEPEPVVDDTYKKLYSEYLLNYLHEHQDEDNSMSMCFSVCDLNGDKMPELISAPVSAHYAGCMIWSVKDGEMVKLTAIDHYSGEETDFFGSSGMIEYYPKTGNIYSGYGGSDHNYNEVYNIDGFEMKSLMYSEFNNEHYFPEEGNYDLVEHDYQYSVNGERVSEKEFHDSYSYFDGIAVPLGQSFTLSEKMVEAVFTDNVGRDKAFEMLMHPYSGWGADHYCYYDIDKDGSDELILDMGYSCDVYSYKDGLVYMGSLFEDNLGCNYGDYYRYTFDEYDLDMYSGKDTESSVFISDDGRIKRVTDTREIFEGAFDSGMVGSLDVYNKCTYDGGKPLYLINYVPVDEKEYTGRTDELNKGSFTELKFREIVKKPVYSQYKEPVVLENTNYYEMNKMLDKYMLKEDKSNEDQIVFLWDKAFYFNVYGKDYVFGVGAANTVLIDLTDNKEVYEGNYFDDAEIYFSYDTGVVLACFSFGTDRTNEFVYSFADEKIKMDSIYTYDGSQAADYKAMFSDEFKKYTDVLGTRRFDAFFLKELPLPDGNTGVAAIPVPDIPVF